MERYGRHRRFMRRHVHRFSVSGAMSRLDSLQSIWEKLGQSVNLQKTFTNHSDPCMLLSMPSLLSPQRHRDRPELEVCEAAPRAAAAQDGEPRARAQGCVRLCCHLAQECVEYPHRLHALPPHLRHGRRAALQRKVLLLQRPLKAHPRRMPVSSIIIGYSSLM